MKRICKALCLLVAWLHAILFCSGCFHKNVVKYKTKPKYETKTERVKVGEKQHFKMVETEPIITLPDATVGVFPFTETTKTINGIGLQAATEIEFWLMNEAGKHGKTFNVVGRTQIESILSERQLSNVHSALSNNDFKTTLKLQYILNGHVTELDQNNIELFLKCTDVATTKLLSSDRFTDSSVRGAVNRAMKGLVGHKKRVPDGMTPIYETRKKQVKVGTEKEPYTVKEVDWFWSVLLWGTLIVGVGIAAGVAATNDK